MDIKEIVGYLPYGLKAEMLDYKIDYVGKQYDEIIGIHQWSKISSYWSLITASGSKPELERIKPILQELSSFKNINSESMNDLNVDLDNQMELCDLANGEITYQNCSYSTILICLKNKIDIYNLIGRGLAISVTEEFNPYKS